MGYDLSWIAFGPGHADVLRGLNLQDTGRAASPGIAPCAGARLPNGWYVVAFPGAGHEETAPERARMRSYAGPIVSCAVSEVANASSAALFEGGGLRWAAIHVLDLGQDHLALEGEPPPSLAAHLATARRLAAKDGFDAVFSVPLILAEEACGFRHERHRQWSFTELAPVAFVAAADVHAALVPLVASTLGARGFTPEGGSDSRSVFASDRGGQRLQCVFDVRPHPGGGSFVEVKLLSVHRIAGGDATMPAGRFSDAVAVPVRTVNAADVAAWKAAIGAELDPWIAGMQGKVHE